MIVFKGKNSWYSSLFPKQLLERLSHLIEKAAKMERNDHHDILSWRSSTFQ